MKSKKLIAIALTVVMALGIAGCSKAGKESTKADTTSKKIVIWAWDGTFNVVAAKEAKAIYQKENTGVEVQIVEMAQDDIVQKLNTNLSSNTTEGLPNIVLIEDYRVTKLFDFIS